jgi:hypothetical protein
MSTTTRPQNKKNGEVFPHLNPKIRNVSNNGYYLKDLIHLYPGFVRIIFFHGVNNF